MLVNSQLVYLQSGGILNPVKIDLNYFVETFPWPQ